MGQAFLFVNRDNHQVSSSNRHIVVAINPSASFGKNATAGDFTVTALEAAGYRVTALRAESFDLLKGMVNRALALTPDALVVVGGDGMVSLAVNAVAQSSVPFAVVPAGSGNDLARGIGSPANQNGLIWAELRVWMAPRSAGLPAFSLRALMPL